MHNNNCRVCGYFVHEPPWGDDGNLPSFDICSCCGVTFGYQDCTAEAVRDYRQRWIKEDTHWFDKKLKPSDWSLAAQMESIPKEFA